jgi:ferritin
MLRKAVEDALNKQVAMEGYASQKYLAMACWCDQASLAGCASFFYQHAEEERLHMLKLVHYINDSGGCVQIPAVEQPPSNYKNIVDLFDQAYAGERKVSQSIDDLVEICVQEKDKQTSHFLQWYVEEQHEEESLYRGIIDKIKLIGTEGRGLYFIDKEVEAVAAQQQVEADA